MAITLKRRPDCIGSSRSSVISCVCCTSITVTASAATAFTDVGWPSSSESSPITSPAPRVAICCVVPSSCVRSRLTVPDLM